MSSTLSARVQGVLLGLAAGDRIGGPIRMALCLADSLVERRRFDLEDVGRRYVHWWQNGGFDTGPVAEGVFDRVGRRVTFQQAVREVHAVMAHRTAGCNPAHRAAPLAMASFLSDDRLAGLAQAEARLTHQDSLAGEVSAAVVLLARALIRETPWPDALARAAEGRHPRVQEALRPARREDLSAGGFAPDVLRAAVYFLSTSPTLAEALERAVAFAGWNNYCPVLVGSVGGAWKGKESIPEEVLRQCDILESVRSAASFMVEGWQTGQ